MFCCSTCNLFLYSSQSPGSPSQLWLNAPCQVANIISAATHKIVHRTFLPPLLLLPPLFAFYQSQPLHLPFSHVFLKFLVSSFLQLPLGSTRGNIPVLWVLLLPLFSSLINNFVRHFYSASWASTSSINLAIELSISFLASAPPLLRAPGGRAGRKKYLFNHFFIKNNENIWKIFENVWK